MNPKNAVTVSFPINLAAYVERYFVFMRHRIKSPLGPKVGPCDFTPLQDKFVSDIAQALHNLHGLQLPENETGAGYFFAQAKRINALWMPARDELFSHGESDKLKAARLFPLPEGPEPQ